MVESARLYRHKLHGIVGRLWWCSSRDSLFLDVFCVLDGDLEKIQTVKKPGNILSKNLISPSGSIFGSSHHSHSPRSSHQIHWIDDCRAFHTMNIDCLCPLHPLMATALFSTLSLPTLTRFRLVFHNSFYRFFLVSFFSLENSQPKHRSTFRQGRKIFMIVSVAVAVEKHSNDL